MNILTYGAEDLNSTFPKFDEVSGLVGFETTAPLFGRGSVKFNQANVEYIGKGFPYSPVINSWQGFHFKVEAISACGLVQWLTGFSERGDLRFNATTGKLEARVNGSLVKTSSKIFSINTRYNLQLFVTVNASYRWIQVKIDDRPLFVLDYFANSGADPANYDRFRWGPFLGGGSGNLLLDDLIVNDANDFNTGGDYGWPGPIAITDAGPIENGTNILNEFGATGAVSVPAALDELDHDADNTFAHTETTRRRHAIRFANPSQPVRGVLEAVGFDAVTRITGIVDDSADQQSRLKLRFRDSVAFLINEVQTLIISNGEAGDTIQFGYEDVFSAVLAFDASLVDVQTEADVIFGELGVVVTGTPGEEYIFTFAEHWSQTRMLQMQASGIFGGSAGGSIIVQRTTLGAGIYEAGEPFGYIPLELSDDAITDAFLEPLSAQYESRTARRRVALDGGIWTLPKANAIELVLRSEIPFSGIADEESLPLGAEDSTSVVNEGGINAFGINEGTGAEGSPPGQETQDETPIETPYLPPSGEPDFHLQPGSPACNAGVFLSEVLYDKDGRQRPNPPSFGAFEGNCP